MNLPLRLLALLALFLPHFASAQTTDFDRWYVLQMQDQHAGYVHMTMETEGDKIVTGSQMQVALRRGPTAVEIEQELRFQETADGKPLQAWTRLKMGAMATEAHYRFTDNGIERVTRQAGQEQAHALPAIEGEWLTPAAAQRYIEEQIEEGAKQIRVRTLDVSMGVKPVEATMTVVGEEEVEVFGKTVPAVVWDAQISVMPGMKMREYVDAEGRSLKTTIAVMPGMEMTMLAADEQLAKAKVGSAPEVMAELLIHPGEGSTEVADPRALREAVYQVTAKPSLPLDNLGLPRTGYQRVVWGDQRTATVIVDLDEPVNPQDDTPNDEHLKASLMLNHEDPAVRDLLAQAIPDNARLTREGLALRLREFVHDHLDQKSLAVGFATASEVARTREGDCSEHAVLLAALLRAAGIPSRTASGLLYVDEFLDRRDVLGGHMWTQAWLDPGDGRGARWVDLDATLGHPYDAGHITLGVATLNDEKLVNELVAMAPLLGGLEVKVTRVELSDQPTETGAAPAGQP